MGRARGDRGQGARDSGPPLLPSTPRPGNLGVHLTSHILQPGPAPMSLYLAAPLFTAAELAFNAELARRLRAAGLTVLVPQEFCAPFGGPPADFAAIYRACIEHLAAARLVVAVLDGADPDSGTCFEVGHASARGIPIIGVRTDIRPGEDGGLPNCMLTRACIRVVHDLDEAVRAAQQALA